MSELTQAERIRQYRQNYYLKNIEKIKARSRQRYAKNKTYYSNMSKEWREKHRDHYLTRLKEYRSSFQGRRAHFVRKYGKGIEDVMKQIDEEIKNFNGVLVIV